MTDPHAPHDAYRERAERIKESDEARKASATRENASWPCDALFERADLVTEMKMLMHHYCAGVKPQPGIEF